MKKIRLGWEVLLSLGLITLSIFLYVMHYVIFRDLRHIFYYGFMDIAFIPINVLLVTLVIHRIVTIHEKRQMLKKLNMVIGAFFSEVGLELLRLLLYFDAEAGYLKSKIVISKEWTQKDFIVLRRELRKHHIIIDPHKGDLAHLRSMLAAKREFLCRLLENPNLLEHDDFTSLMWAVFHLAEELSYRSDVKGLPASDYEHLAGDIKRAYGILVVEWVAYMQHLHKDYPYLFSLAMRLNPFDNNASVVIKK